MKTLKAAVMAALVAGGLTLGGTEAANAQGFSLSIGRGGFYGGPVYGYGYGGGYYGRSYYPSYGYSSFYSRPYSHRHTYVYPSYGYSYPSYGYSYGRWDNDWDRGDWRRFNRRAYRGFDWDD